MHMAAALVLSLLLLAGCGDTLWSGLLPEHLLSEQEEPEPAGPALRLTLRGRTHHAALLQAAGDRRLWRTAGNLVVETDGGRVVATSGFGEVLAATRFDGPDPLAAPAALLDRPAIARRLVDLMDEDRAVEGMRFGIPVECRLSAQPAEEAGLLQVEEACRAEGAGRFTNRFRVQADSGAVLQAEQWIGPGLPLLAVEFPGP
ncbi:YjbF family lipoprotein [Paracraurococcus lichenis]|uniref:YjbF family lipoprotein n=1 Tax=Paracraurococcus lichenis TaxID=3064888 RepID=A0ABT9E697_9PROT|nr:YjbF family lipoprotein [Paracraurococcus sp. LOR1-02]MDO9711661.1 YjbF family lipoprotein [Paracraurococcus sp. LOR1-02]